MHSEYCPLCLLSYEPLPDIEKDDDDDDEEEDEKEKNQLKKLSNVDLSWLRNGIGGGGGAGLTRGGNGVVILRFPRYQ
jgi:hypothetical protein